MSPPAAEEGAAGRRVRRNVDGVLVQWEPGAELDPAGRGRNEYVGIGIGFQRAPGLRPPAWPRADDNAQQLHLDLTVRDMEVAQEHTLALGARPLDLDDDDGERNFRVYADPAGHPFCLCRT